MGMGVSMKQSVTNVAPVLVFSAPGLRTAPHSFLARLGTSPKLLTGPTGRDIPGWGQIHGGSP